MCVYKCEPFLIKSLPVGRASVCVYVCVCVEKTAEHRRSRIPRNERGVVSDKSLQGEGREGRGREGRETEV